MSNAASIPPPPPPPTRSQVTLAKMQAARAAQLERNRLGSSIARLVRAADDCKDLAVEAAAFGDWRTAGSCYGSAHWYTDEAERLQVRWLELAREGAWFGVCSGDGATTEFEL